MMIPTPAKPVFAGENTVTILRILIWEDEFCTGLRNPS